MPALKSGAIDASEWIGPWLDMAIGLHKAAGYYYYPGFHEPGTAQTLGINKRVWDSFNAERAAAHRGCCRQRIRAHTGRVQRQQCAVAAQASDEGTVKILKFDNSLLKGFHEISKDVVDEIGSGDELSKKIYASYQQFRASIMDWRDVAERAFLNSRRLV